MRDNYSLNQLYYSAKALLEKYGFVKEDHLLKVSFAIEEAKQGVHTSCQIVYEHKRNSHYELFSFGSTPDHTLSKFEEEIQEKSNKALVANSLTAEFEDSSK